MNLARHWLWWSVLLVHKLLDVVRPLSLRDELGLVDELLALGLLLKDDIDWRDTILLELELDVLDLVVFLHFSGCRVELLDTVDA